MNRDQVIQMLHDNDLNCIPIKPHSKIPLLSWSEYQSKKFTKSISDDVNLGIICGTSSDNLVVVDVDDNALMKNFEEFLSKTLVVKTQDGFHIYLKVDSMPNTLRLENKKGQRIDVQSQGTYVIGPTSIHPDGYEYTIISNVTSIMKIDFNEIIEKLKELEFDVERKSIKEITKGNFTKGIRHDSAVRYANHLMFSVGLDYNSMWFELIRWNTTNNPPLDDSELHIIAHDVNQYYQNQTVQENTCKLSPEEYSQKLSNEFESLKQNIEKNFPNRSFAIVAGLSVKAQMQIEGITQPFTLIFMGNPSTHKSTILEIMGDLPDSYTSDSFTPRSFVSHSANVKKEELEKVDLLPKIRHKTLITPELAPLFSGNRDALMEFFGMLTRILDGRGFQSDSGVHGKRGYTGDYYFTWLGAVIEIPHRVWSLLGNLGPKIYFFRLPDDNKTGKEKANQIKIILKENSYVARLVSSKKSLKEFWSILNNRPEKGKINWDFENDDDETFDRIIELAMVLSNLRATIPTWFTSDGDSGGTNYNFETPIREDPSRASSALYNVARGHAVLCGRNYITKDDLAVVIPVALSSAPLARVDLFRLMIEHNGTLSTDKFMRLAHVSRATALKEIEKLTILGLVDKSKEEGVTKPIVTATLKSEYKWFLTPEFRTYWDEFRDSLTPSNPKESSTKQENLREFGVCD